MIGYLEGEIIFKKDKFIILNVGGVGYKVFLSKKALSMIPEIGKPLKLFCFTNVKENAIDIYGFATEKELEFFDILEGIRGVGPKTALEISSLGSLDNIKEKIMAKNEAIFDDIPGIGKKKAMTIILELTGKIKDINGSAGAKDEAEEGLVGLGFDRQKAKSVLERIPRNIPSEERIKQSLKMLGK